MSTRLCSPLPSPPLQIRSVPGLPNSSVASKLLWPPASDRIHPMPGWTPPSMPDWSPWSLRHRFLTVLLVVTGRRKGGGGRNSRRWNHPQLSRPTKYRSYGSSIFDLTSIKGIHDVVINLLENEYMIKRFSTTLLFLSTYQII